MSYLCSDTLIIREMTISFITTPFNTKIALAECECFFRAENEVEDGK